MRSTAHRFLRLAALVAVCSPLVPAPPGEAAPPPVYVSPAGNNGHAGTSVGTAWRTLGYAVSQATGGQTIFVLDDGVEDLDDYVENVVVDKGVRIRSYSLNVYRPGLQAASGSSPALQLSAQGAVIEGLLFTGATTSAGIELSGAVACEIRNNSFGVPSSPNRTGLSVSGGYRNIIEENFCGANSETGIELLLTSGNLLHVNWCSDSPKGLHLVSGSGNVLVFNNFHHCDEPLWRALDVGAHARDNVFSHNFAQTSHYGIHLESMGGNLFFENFVNENVIGLFIGAGSGQDVLIKNDLRDNTSSTVGCATPTAYDLGSDLSLLYRFDSSYHASPLGNYYSDYFGTDSDGDGIGDAPYTAGSATDSHPLIAHENSYALKSWMLMNSGGHLRLQEDGGISRGEAPVTFGGLASRTFSTASGATSTWSYCGGDPARDATWSGWLTFASPPAAGQPVRVTVGLSGADGADFRARIPAATITGDGARSILPFTAPAGCLILPAGEHLAVRIENLSVDPFYLMASGAACVVSAPLTSRSGAALPVVPLMLLD